jgi:hypothetical protein
MKAYWGVKVQVYAFLTLALAGGTARFSPRERAPGTHWIGGWVGPKKRSGRGGKDKNSRPLPGLEPPITQPVTQNYTTELPGS